MSRSSSSESDSSDNESTTNTNDALPVSQSNDDVIDEGKKRMKILSILHDACI